MYHLCFFPVTNSHVMMLGATTLSFSTRKDAFLTSFLYSNEIPPLGRPSHLGAVRMVYPAWLVVAYLI